MRSLLIIVDYQNDFVIGEFGFERAVKIENAIANKIRKHRFKGSQIIFTMDINNNGHSPSNGKYNCYNKDDFGYKLYGLIGKEKRIEDICFEKDRYGSCELFDFLREHAFDEVEIVGVVTNICVLVNAILVLTALPSAKITIDCNCVAANDQMLGKFAIDVLTGLHINIKNKGVSL